MMGRTSTWTRLHSTRALFATVIAIAPKFALAANSDSDGVYGRFDGDLTLSPSLGIEQYRGTTAPVLGFKTMYLSTLGIAITHADARFTFGADSSERSATAASFELCPLFLGRWSQAWEAGPPLLDLTLDSLRIDIGAFWDVDHKRGTLRRGTSVSTGLSLPLMANVRGPWLNADLGLRFADAPAFSAQTDLVAGVSVSWNWLVDSSIHKDD